MQQWMKLRLYFSIKVGMPAMMKFFKTVLKNVAVRPSIRQNLVKICHLLKHLSGETLSYMNNFVCFSKLYKKEVLTK